MNHVIPAPVVSKDHQAWFPVLELATREVFERMLASQLSAPVALPTAPFDVTAMVGLAGMLSGVMSVRCQGPAAALMASRMLGIAVEEVGADVSDAIGEVCNMVAGNFKNKIPGLGDGCMLSPPSVVTGADYVVHAKPEVPTLQVSLLFEQMPMVVSLHIHA